MNTCSGVHVRAGRAVSAIALGAALALTAVAAPLPGFSTLASAQEVGGGGSGQGEGGGQGAQAGGGGNAAGGGAQAGGNGPGSGTGSGGGNPDSGGSGTGSGGQPPWTEDALIPDWSDMDPEDFELGRLSVARSPQAVFDRAMAEAELVLADMSDFYNLTLDQMEALLSDPATFETAVFLDSPLQNLALFEDALDGSIDLSAFGITADAFTIMAVTLGVASDKELSITPETAYAMSVIFEDPMTEAEAIALATAAEEIRVAVLSGHG